MHLMVFVEIAKPNWLERIVILLAQGAFVIGFLILHLATPKTAHRLTGYLEEEAIISYNIYLEDIDNKSVENIPAPKIAIDYWNLDIDATLRDVVVAIINDEAVHRDVNHRFANKLIN